MSSSSSTPLCFNRDCRELKPERRRNGWRLRNGDFSKLCDRCASALEEGNFCDTFHQHVAGWRSCESCSKPIHCGCIASAHAFVLLDAGGIICVQCAMKASVLAQYTAQPSLFPPKWQAANLSSFAQSEFQRRMSYLGFNHDKSSLCTRRDMSVAATHHSLASASHSETEPYMRAFVSQPMPISPTGNMLASSLNNGLHSTNETHVQNTKVRADIRSRSQLLSRYCPKMCDQELQQMSGDSNTSISPLFEKMLSASDAGRVGRLVLPKKCAETYFPAISGSEGTPLWVQDVRGQEWVFQFRFWPNNNSRMYVLEGITPCIQSMGLQAGDTVTFSRLEPDGKLILGYRKAASIPMRNQDQSHKPRDRIPAHHNVSAADPVALWSRVDKSGYVARKALGANALISKRKIGRVSSKNKRMKLDTVDATELKVTLEEGQGLLRPHVDHVPKVVLVEEFEFEEYEDAPVIGRPSIIMKASVGGKDVQWAQCDSCMKWRRIPADVLPPAGWTCSDNSWDPERSSCLVAQELSTEQLEDLLKARDAASCKKQKLVKPDIDHGEASDDSPGSSIISSQGSLCIGKEEFPIEQLEHLSLSTGSDASRKYKAATPGSDPAEGSYGLDTFTTSAPVGGNETVSTSAQATTTRHPRHRPGCSCIVCIQPPSGKGPKHMPACICNVCVTVRQRFRTMMMRREQKKQQPDADTVQPDTAVNASRTSSMAEHIVKIEGSDEVSSQKPSVSPSKSQIDLNIRPEREEELSPRLNSINTIETFDGTSKVVNEGADVEQSKSPDLPANTVSDDGNQMESCDEPNTSGSPRSGVKDGVQSGASLPKMGPNLISWEGSPINGNQFLLTAGVEPRT